jgi:hypothetical protein
MTHSAAAMFGLPLAARRRIEVTLFVGVIAILAACGTSFASDTGACAAAAFREFDFWIGDWDAIEADGSTSAHVQVTSILDGCVLLEEYEGMNGANGKSFTIFDAREKSWHQTWVTNRGRRLELDGTLEQGAITLRGADRMPSGARRMVSGTWRPVAGGVRETAVTSIDGGKSWQSWFDILFRPH